MAFALLSLVSFICVMSNGASAAEITLGLAGDGLPHEGVWDQQINIDSNSAALGPETYEVTSFTYKKYSGADANGYIRPFLAVRNSAAVYTVVWVGQQLFGPHNVGAMTTVSFTGETFTLATPAQVHAGVAFKGTTSGSFGLSAIYTDQTPDPNHGTSCYAPVSEEPNSVGVVLNSWSSCPYDYEANFAITIEPSSGGAGGDPHFKTWHGHKYDFHGHCDLVLLDNKDLGGGKGLSVHIRSHEYKKAWSYISNMAIRIGKDILEVGSGGVFFFNGVAHPVLSSKDTFTTNMAGYMLEHTATKKGRQVYKIHLGGKQEIDIREFHDWITITILHASPEDFHSSSGLMGSFQDGTWYARDNTTVMTSLNEFGQEWQVRASTDGLLFQTPSPYPDKCHIPTETDMKAMQRRLGESKVQREDAIVACSHWGNSIEDCVMDVLASGDLGLAGNGPI